MVVAKSPKKGEKYQIKSQKLELLKFRVAAETYSVGSRQFSPYSNVTSSIWKSLEGHKYSCVAAVAFPLHSPLWDFGRIGIIIIVINKFQGTRLLGEVSAVSIVTDLGLFLSTCGLPSHNMLWPACEFHIQSKKEHSKKHQPIKLSSVVYSGCNPNLG